MPNTVVKALTLRDEGKLSLTKEPSWTIFRSGSNSAFGVKTTPGIFHGLIVTTAGVGNTVTVTSGGSTVLVVDTSTVGAYYVDALMTTNITFATAGGTPATITYMYI